MENKPLDRVLILNITIVVEAVLLLLATAWSQFGDIELFHLFRLNRTIVGIGLLSGIATASTGFLLLWLAGVFRSVKWLSTLQKIVSEELTPLFQTLSVSDIFLVAASSGFCEEVFFRGVVQDQLGLWLAAALFGFFHCPTPRHLPYGIWALCAGTFLGWLLVQTGSIWTPIFAHSVSNFIVLLYFRYWRKSVGVEIAKADKGENVHPGPRSVAPVEGSSTSTHSSQSLTQSTSSSHAATTTATAPSYSSPSTKDSRAPEPPAAGAENSGEPPVVADSKAKD